MVDISSIFLDAIRAYKEVKLVHDLLSMYESPEEFFRKKFFIFEESKGGRNGINETNIFISGLDPEVDLEVSPGYIGYFDRENKKLIIVPHVVDGPALVEKKFPFEESLKLPELLPFLNFLNEDQDEDMMPVVRDQLKKSCSTLSGYFIDCSVSFAYIDFVFGSGDDEENIEHVFDSKEIKTICENAVDANDEERKFTGDYPPLIYIPQYLLECKRIMNIMFSKANEMLPNDILLPQLITIIFTYYI
ncbi:MAG: hypothetical protein Harvfovirus2_65 [Harvfovirus sp.]|uniref:Uncharacterized protein n=1 Tax=Harvfovirus sp. TaxID=2487768 RepID=A0A3G5A026_9VIRU|nr:MAG: hypothetical protein Harvfovirus2_65 [Harvfovirus sp.]